MSQNDRVEAYIELYRQQMDHYHKTQQVEWKGNFGVWTLLAAAIYLASEKPIAANHCIVAAIIVPFIVVVVAVSVHGWCLYKIHCSEECDKKYWARYRREARLLLLPGGGRLPADENEYQMRSGVERVSVARSRS